MKPVILLDIDGVLNPKLRRGDNPDAPDPELSDLMLALVRRLAIKGRIAWVSTWQGDLVARLEAQLHLEDQPLQVTITPRPEDADQPTPKLRSVVRWALEM